MVIEFARNVLGISDAQHAEYDPYASRLIITRLPCSLVGKEIPISLVAGSRVADFYGTATVSEHYYCNSSINPEYSQLFIDREFRIVGVDSEAEARVMEISTHPFFVGTLFVPQERSTAASPHPLVTGFIAAARQRSMPEQGG